MSYPFVQAFHDLGPAKGPRLGFLVHMAEGGGTVSYLSHENPNGVSVHFVVEYSGRVVQMLREDHMHSSIRTSDIRHTDDADGFYGRTAAVAVLGSWADIMTTLGPNHATIGIEVEGFAADGPNPAQAAAIADLRADLASRHDFAGNLGHRDFADYKACPGKLVSWSDFGGHGQGGTDLVRFVNSNGANLARGTRSINVSAGTTWYYLDGQEGGKIPGADGTVHALPWIGKPDSVNDQHVIELNTGGPYPDGTQRPTLVVIRSTNAPYDEPQTPVDCDDVVAVELQKASERAAAAVLDRQP